MVTDMYLVVPIMIRSGSDYMQVAVVVVIV